jgi:hypothetical protein
VWLLSVIKLKGFCGKGGEDGWEAHGLFWGCNLEVLWLEVGVGVKFRGEIGYVGRFNEGWEVRALFGWVSGAVVVGFKKEGDISIVFCEGGQPGGLPGVIEGTDGGWEWDSDIVSAEGSKCDGLKCSGEGDEGEEDGSDGRGSEAKASFRARKIGYEGGKGRVVDGGGVSVREVGKKVFVGGLDGGDEWG